MVTVACKALGLRHSWKEEVTNIRLLNCCDSCSNMHNSANVALLDVSYGPTRDLLLHTVYNSGYTLFFSGN